MSDWNVSAHCYSQHLHERSYRCTRYNIYILTSGLRHIYFNINVTLSRVLGFVRGHIKYAFVYLPLACFWPLWFSLYSFVYSAICSHMYTTCCRCTWTHVCMTLGKHERRADPWLQINQTYKHMWMCGLNPRLHTPAGHSSTSLTPPRNHPLAPSHHNMIFCIPLPQDVSVRC